MTVNTHTAKRARGYCHNQRLTLNYVGERGRKLTKRLVLTIANHSHWTGHYPHTRVAVSGNREWVYTNARHTTYPCTRSCESEPAPCPDPGWAGGWVGGPLWPRCRARHSPACPAGEPWTTIGAPPPLHPCNRRHHHTTSIHARATYYTTPAHPRPSPSAPTYPSSRRWTHCSGKEEPARDSEGGRGTPREQGAGAARRAAGGKPCNRDMTPYDTLERQQHTRLSRLQCGLVTRLETWKASATPCRLSHNQTSTTWTYVNIDCKVVAKIEMQTLLS